MRILRVIAGILALTSRLAAQSSAPVPARPLPAPDITSPQFVGAVAGIRALANGMLLINDSRNHHVMLSDSLLRSTIVVIDSTEYGSRPASLFQYPGDSSLFVESVTPSMRLIDPTGKVIRTMAVPQPRDASWLMPSPSGIPGVDARGRLVHRGVAPRAPEPNGKPGEFVLFAYPDSAPVVRDDPTTHRGDTLAWTKGSKLSGTKTTRADGRSMSYMRMTPLPTVDDWTVLADGTIAIVRGRDFHVDLIGADGITHALPKISYAWQHLTDSIKVALLDSLRIEREKPPAPRSATSAGTTTPATAGAASSGAGTMNGGSGTASSGGMAPRGLSNEFPPAPPGSQDAKLEDLPDYRPAFGLGALHADADGNLWIRTNEPVADGNAAIYDVINSKGMLIDRLRVPNDRRIAGFDRNGHVFLLGRADGGVQWIERVRWK